MKWDLYDKDFHIVGKTINEMQSDEIPDGLYHLTVNVWIVNPKKQVLLIKKSLNFNLRYPGLWTSINGDVQAGDNSLECLIKIVKDKIGIDISSVNIKEVGRDTRDPHKYIYNTFVVFLDLDLKNLKLKEDYISKVKWADLSEIDNMINNGEIEMPLVPRIEKYVKPFLI